MPEWKDEPDAVGAWIEQINGWQLVAYFHQIKHVPTDGSFLDSKSRYYGPIPLDSKT